ncbi:hypothetical protein A2U01_0022019, partial [Trifolium medium]|nr:hypothetical protein [Trifolium medium]
VRIVLTYNTHSDHLATDVRLLNTLPYAQHYWAWCVDINGGWPDNGNLITACKVRIVGMRGKSRNSVAAPVEAGLGV